MVVIAIDTPRAARKVPLAWRRAPASAPFDDAFVVVALETAPVRVPVGVCVCKVVISWAG